jgi:23S rRNA (uracil1939-C5)-methyltransferase
MDVKRRAALKRQRQPERKPRVSLRRSRPERTRPMVLPARQGDEAETVIERIVPGGLGLGYGGGRTLFVSRAAPGDRLRVRIDREQGRVAHASIVEILEAGPDRIPEPYPRLSRCGADFQHLRYEAQLAAKGAMIADSLRRVGGIQLADPVVVAPSPETWRYRARAEWRHDPVQPALGYLETGTRRVVDLPDDPFVIPALGARFAELRERMIAGRLPEWATELRAAAGDDGVSFAPPLELPQPLPVHATVAGERYAFDADCFFQVNPFVLDGLVAEALRFAAEPGASSSGLAIDLYCGVGLFTVPLSRRYERVIGVEGQPRAAEFAQRNTEASGLRNVQIQTGSVERWLDGAYRSHGRPRLVLLDPPRTGLPPPALRALPRLRAARIAYVSCDSATLARDLKGLIASGNELVAIAAIDMFPQTHHVEIVAHLERTPTYAQGSSPTGSRPPKRPASPRSASASETRVSRKESRPASGW